MNHSANQSIIEATISSAIKRIENDPERSIRNLVDMGVMFCNGKFQQRFLAEVQRMLENEQSSYYRIIPDLISSVDSKRITTFGINLGYQSCTKGARIIRKTEAEQNCNVPWCIFIDLQKKTYSQMKEKYFSLIEQGQSLGTYTWFVNPHSDILSTLELAEHFTDSAFVIICNPNDITEIILDEFSEVYNVFFIINYKDGIEDACALLRKRKFLFSVLYKYQEHDIENILNHSILYDLCSLHSLFSFFYANTECPLEMQQHVYEYIKETRYKQSFQTIPFDLIYDVRFIDEIISEDAVTISFDSNGICHTDLNNKNFTTCNLFHTSLINIFKQVVPKE